MTELKSATTIEDKALDAVHGGGYADVRRVAIKVYYDPPVKEEGKNSSK